MTERLFIGGPIDGEWRQSKDVPLVEVLAPVKLPLMSMLPAVATTAPALPRHRYRLCHCSCPAYDGQPPLTVSVYVHEPMRFYDAMIRLLVNYTPRATEDDRAP